MKQLGRYAQTGMRIALVLLLALLIPGCFECNVTDNVWGVAMVLMAATGVCVLTVFAPVSEGRKTALLIAIALFVRLLWNWNVSAFPASDYKTIYDAAGALVAGDVTAFWGVHYLARFPHLTVTALYMAAMRYLFGAHALIALRGANILAGVVSVYLVGGIAEEIFGNARAKNAAIAIAAVFPPMVTYTAAFCSETYAMPFYLAGVYLFLRLPRGGRKTSLLCGLCLAVGYLFRSVATVTLIAFLLYLLLFDGRKGWQRLADGAKITACYTAVIALASTALQMAGITQYPLWGGAEPHSANVLKGVNVSSGGRWNAEDAAFIEENLHDRERLDALCREKIRARLDVSAGEKWTFYRTKFVHQWRAGDFAGAYWAQQGAERVRFPVGDPLCLAFQVFYAVLLLLFAVGLLRRNLPPGMCLCLLMICGYGSMYLVTEMQPRYGYIVSWLFVLFAVNGIYTVANGAKLLYNRTIMRKR